MRNKEKGAYGERLAAEFIEQKGYEIYRLNYKCMLGEIDIICTDGSSIIFTEVKYRTSLAYGYPCEAVNYKKQAKIKKVASYYICVNEITDMDFRFDVIEIIDGKTLVINHIENAFQ